MAHISRGSAALTADGWRLVGYSGPEISYEDDIAPRDRATGRFESDDHPGVRVIVTFLTDGTLLSFEVHNVGVERAYSRTERTLRADGTDRPIADTPITVRLIRSVRVTELVRATRARLAELVADIGDGLTDERVASQMARHVDQLRAGTRRPGRRGHDDRYHAELAVAYEAWQRVDEPIAVLAERWGLSVGGLRAALYTARRKGFLTEAPPGRAGGMATDRAKEITGGIDR